METLRINLRQLEAFAATAEQESFTLAAQELYLTQSTVSAHIAALERALGARLIVRGARRRVTLTPEGKQTYRMARDILSRCRRLEALAGEDTGELSVGASTVPAQYLLPSIMAGFSQKNEDCRYVVKRDDSAGIHRLLADGMVRLGFVGAALDPKNYVYHTLTEDRLVLITAANDRFCGLRERGVSGRELLDEPMLLREETSGTERAMEAYLRRTGIPADALRVVARMENPESIKKSVARGMGVAVISQLAVREETAAGSLLEFDLDPEGVYRKIYVMWRKGVVLTRLEQSFAAYARAAAKAGNV